MNGYAVIPMSEYLKERRRCKALEKELASAKRQIDAEEAVIAELEKVTAALKEEVAWYNNKLKEILS